MCDESVILPQLESKEEIEAGNSINEDQEDDSGNDWTNNVNPWWYKQQLNHVKSALNCVGISEQHVHNVLSKS